MLTDRIKLKTQKKFKHYRNITKIHKVKSYPE